MINENNKTFFTEYDKVDRVTETINPLNQRHTFVYDDAGRQTKRTDANGNVTTLTYDNVDRLTGRIYPDSSRVTFTYDAVGNRLTMENSTGSYVSTFDNVNQVETVTSPGTKIITYTYDNVGRRKTMIDPDSGLFTYDYDQVGRLTKLVNPGSETTTFTFDAAGRMTLQELGNGTRASMVYDAASRLQTLTNLNSSNAVIDGYAYGFDGAGNRTSQDTHDSDYSNWLYDGTNQLTQDDYFASSTLGWSTLTLPQWDILTASQWESLLVDPVVTAGNTAAFDPAGNPLTRIDVDTGNVTTYTYDSANRMLAAEDPSGITTYTYDANGNQLTIEEPGGDVTTNTWDYENRLIAVEHPDFSLTTYAYDPDGHRVEIDDGVAVTQFIYDGNNVLQETDDVGVVEAEFTYVPAPYAHVVSQDRDGETSFYHFDGIHNTSALTDDAEVITDEYSLDAWGKLRSSTGSTANSQIYKGEYLAYYKDPHAGPESIYSLRYRSYSVDQFRFTSEDPAKDDLNPYRPVGNNPVNEVDPSGLESHRESWGSYRKSHRSRLMRALGDTFSVDTLWWMIGYDVDEEGELHAIMGGVHKQYIKDQATNAGLAFPATRVPMILGTGIDLGLQGLGKADDYINDRPIQPLNLSRTQDIALLSGVLGPAATRWKPFAGFLMGVGGGLGIREGMNNFGRGNYFEGTGDFALAWMFLRTARGPSGRTNYIESNGRYTPPKGTVIWEFNPKTGQFEIPAFEPTKINLRVNKDAPSIPGSEPLKILPVGEFVAPRTSGPAHNVANAARLREQLGRQEFASQARWKTSTAHGDELAHHAYQRHPSLATNEAGLIDPQLYNQRTLANITAEASEIHQISDTRYAAFNSQTGEFTVFSWEGGGGLSAGSPTLHSYYIPLRNQMRTGIPFQSQGVVRFEDIRPR